MLRSTASVIGLVLVTSAVSSAAPPQGSSPFRIPALKLATPDQSVIQLRADELSFQPGSRRIDLKGRVRIQLEAIVLTSDRLQVELDARSRPLRIEARGAVRVQIGAARGQADELTLSLGSAGRQLELRRRARLSGVGELPILLEGDRIHLDLPSGRLRVSAAQARLGGSGSTPPTRRAP